MKKTLVLLLVGLAVCSLGVSVLSGARAKEYSVSIPFCPPICIPAGMDWAHYGTCMHRPAAREFTVEPGTYRITLWSWGYPHIGLGAHTWKWNYNGNRQVIGSSSRWTTAFGQVSVTVTVKKDNLTQRRIADRGYKLKVVYSTIVPWGAQGTLTIKRI